MKTFIVLALIAYVSAASLPSAERQVIQEWQIQPRLEADEDKIVGGYDAKLGWFPFIVSMRYRSSRFHFCGGTIIKGNRVLTAAHCTNGQSASQLDVAGGQLRKNSDTDDGREQIIRVSSIAQHKSYNPSTTNYDFAVLRLSSSFSLNSYVYTAKLGSTSVGKTVYVAGWGALSEGGSSPNTLQYLSLPVISNSECDNNYGSGAITDAMMCAGYMRSSGKDSCQGDSGGPLTVGSGTSATVVGVVSWGYGCARYGYPGVYAKVSKVQSWINGI